MPNEQRLQLEPASPLQAGIARIAVPAIEFMPLYNELIASGWQYGVDPLPEGLLLGQTDANFEQTTTADQRHELSEVSGAINSTFDNNPSLIDGSSIGWGKAAADLLTVAQASESTERRSTALLAAFSCSMLSGDAKTKAAFIKTVFDTGLNKSMAEALSSSSFVLTSDSPTDQPNIQGYASYSGAFSVSPEDFQEYTRHRDLAAAQQNGHTTSKQTQKAVSSAYESDNADETLLSLAQAESYPKANKLQAAIDPYKNERYGIQMMFMKDQLRAVFPDGTLGDNPFASGLKARRPKDVREGDSFGQLADDAKAVLAQLTEPIIEQYKADPSKAGEDLTIKQRAAARFKYIAQKTTSFLQIADYIDGSGSRTMTLPDEIWTFPMQGDGLGNVLVVIGEITDAARSLERTTGDKPSQDELYMLAQQQRKSFVGLAMVNIADQRSQTELGDALMVRDEDGSLVLSPPIVPSKIKDAAPVQSGVTLGCVAGRLALEGASVVPRGLYATDSFLDYLVEGIVDEAYQRGMFNIDTSTKPVDQ